MLNALEIDVVSPARKINWIRNWIERIAAIFNPERVLVAQELDFNFEPLNIAPVAINLDNIHMPAIDIPVQSTQDIIAALNARTDLAGFITPSNDTLAAQSALAQVRKTLPTFDNTMEGEELRRSIVRVVSARANFYATEEPGVFTTEPPVTTMGM